ncbi:hypothetical protein [Rhizobium sp. A41-96]
MQLFVIDFYKSNFKVHNIAAPLLKEWLMDRYTKTVLTIIAVALAAIAIQNTITPAQAVGGGCGTETYRPCYVKLVN